MSEDKTAAEGIGEAMMAMLEGFVGVPAAAAGYRQQCIEQGFSKEAAEEMAVDYHKGIQRLLWTQIAGGIQ